MTGYDVAENIADASLLGRMLSAIRHCPHPTIARVQGAAFGGGVGLVAACDMAIAVEQASFCLSEVRLGIIPAVISPFLREKVTARGLHRYALTAERFSATQAEQIGLLTAVAKEASDMDAWIARVAAALTECGPAAVAACKALFGAIQDLPLPRAVEIATERIAAIRVSAEGQEGLHAFLEKRSPAWRRKGD
jgi:methylglutaconyl-CoA hydratase